MRDIICDSQTLPPFLYRIIEKFEGLQIDLKDHLVHIQPDLIFCRPEQQHPQG